MPRLRQSVMQQTRCPARVHPESPFCGLDSRVRALLTWFALCTMCAIMMLCTCRAHRTAWRGATAGLQHSRSR